LTGRVLHPMARFTVYPSSHYVTPRETTLRAVDAIKAQLGAPPPKGNASKRS